MNHHQNKHLTAAIAEWLLQIGKDRSWLAQEIGVSIGTVNGWFSEGSNRPIPKPTANLIENLMRSTDLGEPTFTFQESLLIQRAMQQADYTAFVDFAHDAVVNESQRIISEAFPPLSKVAEEPAEYRVNRTGRQGTS